MHESPGHLVFSCGGALFALPAGAAAEIVNLPQLTRVPAAPPHVLGVFSLREELLAVVDVPALAGQPVAEWKRAVVLRTHDGVVAIAVSQVLGVAPLSGTFAARGSRGLDKHLRGPLDGPYGEVSAIEPRGFFEFLARPA